MCSFSSFSLLLLFLHAVGVQNSSRTSVVCRNVLQCARQWKYLGSLKTSTCTRWPSLQCKLQHPSATTTLTSLVIGRMSPAWSLVLLTRSDYWYLLPENAFGVKCMTSLRHILLMYKFLTIAIFYACMQASCVTICTLILYNPCLLESFMNGSLRRCQWHRLCCTLGLALWRSLLTIYGCSIPSKDLYHGHCVFWDI